MHTVREFVEAAFAQIGCGSNGAAAAATSRASIAKIGKVLVAIDPRYFRPTEVDRLLGDATKARQRSRLAAKALLCRHRARDGRQRYRALASEPRRFGATD